MHDILEGALQYEAKLLLQHFIGVKKFFRLSFLNELIEQAEMGYLEEKNRPAPVSTTTLRC